jgi:predicted DNA-binding transcriptional regulator AlpA
MKQSKHREDGASNDLFADTISIGQGGAANRTSAETQDGECFPNAYAEASQARASGRRPLAIHHDSSGGSDQPSKNGTNHKGTLGQSLADNRGQTDIAQLEPAKVMPQPEKAGKEHPLAVAIPRMMTVAEVATFLRVSVSKVWRLTRRQSDFPRPVRIGGSTRWDRQAIDCYLDSLQPRRDSGR